MKKRKPVIKKVRPIRIKEETLLGMAWPELREIHISARQSPKEMLDTLIHEVLHICHPAMAEQKVESTANEVCEILWRLGYRRVVKEEKK